MPRLRTLLTLALLSLALTACPHGDPPLPGMRPAGTLVIVPGIGDGPGVSIEEAVARTGDDPVLVNGALVVDSPDGPIRLCTSLAESYPPQCGSPWLEVRGLDLSTIAGLQEAEGVRWADAVQLLGRVEAA